MTDKPNYSTEKLPGIDKFLKNTKAKLEDLDDPHKNPYFFENAAPTAEVGMEQVLEKFDSTKGLKKSILNLNRPIGIQPIAISYGQDWSGAPLCIMGQGDYSVITGVSKSRKSFFKSAMMANYIGLMDDGQWPHWKTHREGQKIVIDIDTEQSPHHAQKSFRRVEQLVGGPYKRYFPFSWRRYQPKERLEMLEQLIDRFKDEIGLISIDGYIDLVDDYMDSIEAQALAQKLLTWTDKYKMHITGILHLNPNGEKMIGHMGSTFQRKAGTIIRCSLDPNDMKHSIIEHGAARDEKFDSFSMRIDRGLPVFNETLI